MTMVQIDLCANGRSLALIETEDDWSGYSKSVSLNDTEGFWKTVIFYLGGGHGIMSLKQFAGIEFTIDVHGDLNKADAEKLEELMTLTDAFIVKLVGGGSHRVVGETCFIVIPQPKH